VDGLAIGLMVTESSMYTFCCVRFKMMQGGKSFTGMPCSLKTFLISEELDHPCETLVSLCHFQTNLTGLVHAMRSNGPLHQVKISSESQ
jgi:hypothetical protein